MDFLQELHQQMGLDPTTVHVAPKPEAELFSAFYVDLQLLVSMPYPGNGLEAHTKAVLKAIADQYPGGIPLSAVTAAALRAHEWMPDNYHALTDWTEQYGHTHHPDGTPKYPGDVPDPIPESYHGTVNQEGGALQDGKNAKVWALFDQFVKSDPFGKEEPAEIGFDAPIELEGPEFPHYSDGNDDGEDNQPPSKAFQAFFDDAEPEPFEEEAFKYPEGLLGEGDDDEPIVLSDKF